MKKESSHSSIKEEQVITNYKSNHRPISAANKRPASSNQRKLPSLSNNTFDLPTNTNSKAVGHQIEKEKLFEETMQLKIVISKLKKELSKVTNESKKKDFLLTLKDQEIEGIIEDFDNPECCQTPQDNNLILKLKHQFKQLKKDYDEEYKQSLLLKQNYKITKMNELNMEQEIFNKKFHQLTALYENSLEVNNSQKKKLSDFSQIKENIKNQNIIIESLKDSIANTKEIEEKLHKSIEDLNTQAEKDQQTMNKCLEDNALLQKQIDNLAHERKKAISNTKAKDNCLRRIVELEGQLKYYKSQAMTSNKTLAELQSTKALLEQTKQRDKEDLMENYKVIKSISSQPQGKALSLDSQLQQTLEEAKKKEKFLEDKFNEYQEKIQQLIKENKANQHNQQDQSSSSGYGLNNDNPFYTSDDTNDPILSKKMTSNQYNQLTYILFKNFEAKKINKDIANEKIITPTFENNSSNDTLEVIVNKFLSNILQLLNCKNEVDKQRLELYLSALFYNFEGDVNKVIESFLMLFSYIQVYSPEKEEKLCIRIITKYKEKFEFIKESIGSSKEFISLLEIKKVFDEKNIELKDKYIEFLFYKMKQFDDSSASLFDLKVKKLEELLDMQSSPMSESVQEITDEEYERYIKESLTMIKKGLNKYKKTFRQIIKESIVKLAKPVTCDAISIEALNDEMKKMNVQLNEIQLSCMCTKYCANNELRALNVEHIEMDLKKIVDNDYNDDDDDDEDNEEQKINHTD